jgi:hypothetical protein
MRKIRSVATAVIALLVNACNNSAQTTKAEKEMEQKQINMVLPTAGKWVKSPLRNRIQLELDAPVADVWTLLGDLTKMPVYSGGLNKVEAEEDTSGKCTAYTCYFIPIQPGEPGIVHGSKMVWYEPGRGWASLDEEPNEFGFEQSLTLLTLEEREGKTLVDWSMYFECGKPEMLQPNISSLELALNEDIAQRLISGFGGKLLQSYVYGK